MDLLSTKNSKIDIINSTTILVAMNSPGPRSGSGSSVRMPGKMNFLSILIFSTKYLKVKSVEAEDFLSRYVQNIPEK